MRVNFGNLDLVQQNRMMIWFVVFPREDTL